MRSSRQGSDPRVRARRQTGAPAADSDTAVKFDAVNDYVTVPNAAALNPAQFTVEAWVNAVSVAGGWRAVAESYDEAPSTRNVKGYWLGSNGTNWMFETGNGTTTTPTATGSAVTLAKWTHLVATYDGTTLRLYVNATLAASVVGGYQANALLPSQIGATYYRNSGNNGDFFNGTIDDVAVYNRAFSATEVQLHYDSGRQ